MAETEQPDKNERSRKANGVEKYTAFVLTITMFGALYYAWEARRANQLNTRPYVIPTCQTDLDRSKANLTFATGNPLAMWITVFNVGRLPANALLWSTITYSSVPLDRATPFPEKPDRLFILPNSTSSTMAKSPPLANEDKDSIQRKIGYIYLAVKAQYSDHETRICKEFTLSEVGSTAGNSMLLPLARLCKDPDSNYAD